MIQVKLSGNRVRKTYRKDINKPELATAKFKRELHTYKFFDALNVDFVPRLLAYNQHELWLETSWAGKTLSDWLETASTNAVDIVISQIIAIDRFLYLNKINYLESSPYDILVSDNYCVSIIDFEYTFLNEPFQQILYEKIFHERMETVTNARVRQFFLACLSLRRDEFHGFLSRKIQNSILGRLGLLRTNRLETE